LARKAVDWENHKFESSREGSYIVKNFIFQFVNSYITLFYLSYIKQSQQLLSSTLVSTILTKTFVQTAKEIALPFAKFHYYRTNFTDRFETFKQYRKKKNEQILMETKEVLGDIKDIARLEDTQSDENLILQQQVEETRIMQTHQDLLDEYTNLVSSFVFQSEKLTRPSISGILRSSHQLSHLLHYPVWRTISSNCSLNCTGSRGIRRDRWLSGRQTSVYGRTSSRYAH
jgi:thioester reductase-like protein